MRRSHGAHAELGRVELGQRAGSRSTGYCVADEVSKRRRDPEQCVEVDAGVDALILEHEHEVFRCEVAAHAGLKGEPPAQADRGVESRDAGIEAGERISRGQSLGCRAGAVLRRRPLTREYALDSSGCRRADRVGQGHAADAGVAHSLDDAGDRAERDVLVR